MATPTTSYILDFDSTFIQSEGLDELADFALAGNPEREEIVKKIQELTRLGMEGKVPFEESLRQRVALLTCTKKQVTALGKLLKKQVSVSILRNKEFFMQHKDTIYIVSGGFKELILPVVKQFGIKPDHVFANTFIYDAHGTVTGIDTTNPMSKNGGKVRVVKALNLKHDFFIIGDGNTDYELRKQKLAKKFIAFTENIERAVVVKNADEVASTFDEFLYVNKLPRTLSYPKNRISILSVGALGIPDRKLLENEGYQVNMLSDEEGSLITNIENSSVLLLPDPTLLTQELIDHSSRLLAIGIFQKGPLNKTNAAAQGIALFSGDTITKKIISYINTGNTHTSHTIPNLNLPKQGNVHRLLHMHHNVPGILAQINSVLAEHEINILGQYLKTTEEIGYVIIDVDKEYDKAVLKILKRIPDTIRFRILY